MQEQTIPFDTTQTRPSTGGAAEKAVKISVVKHGVSQLVSLYWAAHEAKEDFSTSLKAVAEGAGVLPAVLRKLVKARAGDKFDKARKEVEQLAMVFEEAGE